MLGSTNSGNSGLVYYLGSGTSFDVSNIPGYQNLTADNFIVGATRLNLSGGGRCPYRDDIRMSCGGGGTITKSYNAQTGKLTIGTISGSVSVNNGGPSASVNLGEYFAYLVKGNIKQI